MGAAQKSNKIFSDKLKLVKTLSAEAFLITDLHYTQQLHRP